MNKIDELFEKATAEDLKELENQCFIFAFLEALGKTSKENVEKIKVILDKYDIQYHDDLLTDVDKYY